MFYNLIRFLQETIRNKEELRNVIQISIAIIASIAIGLLFLFMPLRNACLIVILIISVVATVIEPFTGLLAMVFVYFCVLSNIKYTSGVGELRPIFFIVFGTLLFWLFNKVTTRSFTFVYSFIDIVLLLLWVGMYVSTLDANVSSQVSWVKNIDFLKTIVTYFLITNLANTSRKFNIFFWSIAFGSFFLGLIGVRMFLHGGSVRTSFDLIGGGELGGANELASTLGLLVPFCYYKIFSRNRSERILAIIFLPVLILCIIFSSSRAGTLQLVGICILMLIKTRQRLKALIIFIGIIFLFVSFAPQEYWDRMKTITNYQEDASAMGRIEIWKIAIKVWKDNFVTGVGQRNFMLVCKEYDPTRIYDTHNTYFQLLVEGGILTLIPFLILLYVTFMKIRFIKKYSAPEFHEFPVYYLALSIEIGLIGFFIASFFGVYGYFNPLYWFIGLTGALKNIVKNYGYIDIDKRKKL